MVIKRAPKFSSETLNPDPEKLLKGPKKKWGKNPLIKAPIPMLPQEGKGI